MSSRSPNTSRTAAEPHDDRTRGEKAADAVTSYIGSWHFVITACVIMTAWIALNREILPALGVTPFDPKPYGQLNLALSCIAALQASIVMIAQNRADKKAAEREQRQLGHIAKTNEAILTLLEEEAACDMMLTDLATKKGEQQ